MAVWKPASKVFGGGTEEIKRLKGRRVRARVDLQLPIFDPIHHREASLSLNKGDIGLVSVPHPTRFDFLLAFPGKQTPVLPALDALVRSGDFHVVMVNEPTFKLQFELED